MLSIAIIALLFIAIHWVIAEYGRTMDKKKETLQAEIEKLIQENNQTILGVQELMKPNQPQETEIRINGIPLNEMSDREFKEMKTEMFGYTIPELPFIGPLEELELDQAVSELSKPSPPSDRGPPLV